MKFSNLINYKDFYYIINRKLLAIKGKKNFNLIIKDTLLRLLNMIYILDFIINFIITIKL